MKIIICNSKKWFKLKDATLSSCELLEIKEPNALTIANLREFEPDIVFFPHWSWVVDEEIFSNFKCVVFHAAPLPFGRGGSPIQNLVLRGFKSTPVCAIKMDKGVDTGPIYDKRLISLEGSLSQILGRLNTVVNELIQELIIKLPQPKPQVGEVYNFTRLTIKDNELRPDLSFEEIYDRIRMLDDQSYPSSYVNFGNVIFEFSDVCKLDSELTCKVRIMKKGKL